MSERFKRWWNGDDMWEEIEEIQAALIETQRNIEDIETWIKQYGGTHG